MLQERFSYDQISCVHSECLASDPEALQVMLAQFQGRFVPPLPPREHRSDETWARPLLRDAAFYY